MATCIVSALTGIPVRRDVAMTGEITLRGRVLPIGGLKDKVLAAHRGGVKTVLIPMDNKKDLRDIPKRIRNAVEIIPVDHVDQVLRLALTDPEQVFNRKPPPAEDAAEEIAAKPASAKVDKQSDEDTKPAPH
jgi:ATP-dependent Lon protease